MSIQFFVDENDLGLGASCHNNIPGSNTRATPHFPKSSGVA